MKTAAFRHECATVRTRTSRLHRDFMQPRYGVNAAARRQVQTRVPVSRKVNANLVALGSAAIITLYALGYARTQSAEHAPAAVSSTTQPAAGGTPGPAPATARTTAGPMPDTPTAIARIATTT